MTAYISLLVSIVTFVSRTLSETSLAALGALTGYEIRETQSISRLFELRDSTSERHGSRRFPLPFGSSRSYMTSFRYVSQSSPAIYHQS